MSRGNSQIKFSDLTGGINNTYSKENVNATPKKTETPDMVNVDYFKLGGIKTMDGNRLVGNSGFAIQDSAIVGGFEYTKNNKRYMIIGLENGEVRIYNRGLDYKESLKNPFELVYKFPSSSQRMSFCNMNNGVVVTNGIDDLLFYEKGNKTKVTGSINTILGSPDINGIGTKFKTEIKVGTGILINGRTYYVKSVEDDDLLVVDKHIIEEDVVNNYKLKLADTYLCNATLINSDTDKDIGGLVNVPIRGLAIQYYKGRLWVGGKTGLFYSAVGLPNNWDVRSDAGAFYDLYNDSSEVKALGLFSDYLMVHKEFSTYILTCDRESESISVSPFSNITCNSQQSWIVSNTKYFVYSRDFMDIYPLVQHTVFSDKFLGEPITQKVRNIFIDLDQNSAENIFCVSRPRERQMLFYLPTSNCTGSGEALIFDFQTKSFLLRRLPKDIDVTCVFNFNNNIYIGTRDGMVLQEFIGKNFTKKSNETEVVSGLVPGKVDNVQNNISIDITRLYEGVEGVHSWQMHFRLMDESEHEIEYHTDSYDINDTGSLDDQLQSFLNTVINYGGIVYTDETKQDFTIKDVDILEGSYWDGSVQYIGNADITIEEDGLVERDFYIYKTKEIGIDAYYKTPWLDWFGNYKQSFAEFFVEVDDEYDNQFYIRTQKDGTSRYEDRRINSDKLNNGNYTMMWNGDDYSDDTHWGGTTDDNKEYKHNNWAKLLFDSLRMLLPNNVFESFQLEVRTNTDNETEEDKLNRGFHIYQYGFRRIETEEAPW